MTAPDGPLLDPDVAAWIAAAGEPLDFATAPIEVIREATAGMAELGPSTGTPVHAEPLAWADRGRHFDGILYHPAPERPLPLLVFLHGGGFVAGTPGMLARPAARLAELARVAVLTPSYPLAPEARYPDAIEHVAALMSSLSGLPTPCQLDFDQLGLGGESAGGQIALAAAARLATSSVAIGLLALLYPMVEPAYELPSYHTFRDGPVLTTAAVRRYWQLYDAEASTPDPVPSLVADAPTILIASCELDPLRSEATRLATRLRSSHIDVLERNWTGMCHGSWFLDDVSAAARAHNEAFAQDIAAAIRR